MRSGRGPALAATAFAFLLAAPGCVPHRPDPAAGSTYGIYSGSFRGADARELRFRLWLFAEPPDRIHAEVLGPAGGAKLVVDGGNGAISVTLVESGESFVGPANLENVGAALGVRASLVDLVAALRRGGSGPDGRTFTREPADGPGYPLRFEADAGGGRLTLALRNERALGGPADSLGTGTPPPGTTVRPIAELRAGPWGAGPVDGGQP